MLPNTSTRISNKSKYCNILKHAETSCSNMYEMYEMHEMYEIGWDVWVAMTHALLVEILTMRMGSWWGWASISLMFPVPGYMLPRHITTIPNLEGSAHPLAGSKPHKSSLLVWCQQTNIFLFQLFQGMPPKRPQIHTRSIGSPEQSSDPSSKHHQIPTKIKMIPWRVIGSQRPSFG